MAALLFENSYGERRQIADCANWEEVNKAINEFIKQANARKPADKAFKPYYIRTWEEGGATKIDVGSHVEFFIFRGLLDNNVTDRNGSELNEQ